MQRTFWYHLVNFWTLVVFGLITYNYVKGNRFETVLNPAMVIYVGLLTIYVGAKEFERWFENHTSMHPGELHVIAWTILIVAIVISNLTLNRTDGISPEVISTYISVLSILAISQKSKALYREKHKK